MGKELQMTKAVKEQVEPMQLELAQVTRTKSIFNQNQIQKLFNSTPQRSLYTRPAKGGGNWTYIKTSYVRRVLDSIFGFNWDFEIETTIGEAFEVAKMTGFCVVKGTLIGRVEVDKQWVTVRKTQVGRAEVKFMTVTKNGEKTLKLNEFTGAPQPLDFGNDMKAACSDALKKCASLLGIGADVYDPTEFMKIEIVGSDENSERKKNLAKQIKNAKRTVRTAASKVGGQNEQSAKDKK